MLVATTPQGEQDECASSSYVQQVPADTRGHRAARPNLTLPLARLDLGCEDTGAGGALACRTHSPGPRALRWAEPDSGLGMPPRARPLRPGGNTCRHAHTCTHACSHTQVHTHSHTCTHSHACLYSHACTFTCALTPTHAHFQTLTHACSLTYTYAHTQGCSHSHACTRFPPVIPILTDPGSPEPALWECGEADRLHTEWGDNTTRCWQRHSRGCHKKTQGRSSGTTHPSLSATDHHRGATAPSPCSQRARSQSSGATTCQPVRQKKACTLGQDVAPSSGLAISFR